MPTAPSTRLVRARQAWLRSLLIAWSLVMAVLVPAAGAEPELSSFDLLHSDEGLFLSYTIDFDLPRGVDDALAKTVPLFFVAEASVFRSRWYWRDARVAHAVRTWRIVYQPLTGNYRVTFGGLGQNYATREEALASISRASRWRIAEPGQIDDGSRYYVEFHFRLDTSLLPRPMQIGLGGQVDWNLDVQRTQRIDR